MTQPCSVRKAVPEPKKYIHFSGVPSGSITHCWCCSSWESCSVPPWHLCTCFQTCARQVIPQQTGISSQCNSEGCWLLPYSYFHLESDWEAGKESNISWLKTSMERKYILYKCHQNKSFYSGCLNSRFLNIFHEVIFCVLKMSDVILKMVYSLLCIISASKYGAGEYPMT